MVDGSLNPIIEFQNNSKQKFLADTKFIVEEMKLIYAGPKSVAFSSKEIGGKSISLINVLFNPQADKSQHIFKKDSLKSEKTADLFIKSLNANFKGQGLGAYGKIGATGINPFGEDVNNDGFFGFFVAQLNNVDPVTTSDIGEWIDNLSDETFTKDLNKVFTGAQEIKEESAKLFNQTINEGGKNTNVFAANLKAMKKIIKSAKGD